MKTLEQKIDEHLLRKLQGNSVMIRDWRWFGPGDPTEFTTQHLIREAPWVECMLSPALYIREYRRWHEEQKEIVIIE